MIYLGADHRGYRAKEALKPFLQKRSIAFEDLGAHEYNPDDDYPDFAFAVAKKVAEHPEVDKGILLCGSGMGMDVAANKVKGARATVAYSKDSALHARSNDNINVITMAADHLSLKEITDITMSFLETTFSGEERHVRRLEKIKNIESEN